MNKELTPLDALKHLESIVEIEMDEINYKEDISIIKNALKEFEILVKIHSITINCMKSIEKSLKALEIIKEKEVHIADFIYSCKCSQNDLRTYHFCDSNYELACSCIGYGKEQLTQEEYDLLKEVLL